MHEPSVVARLRFGPFTLDVRSGELHKGPTRLKVPDQSLEILKALLERPGALVTRDELRERLWPKGTFVDFEHGLNAAVRRLRDALGDAADHPTYIETLPRRGYRFIGSIDATPSLVPPGTVEEGAAASASRPQAKSSDSHRARPLWPVAVISIAGAIALVFAGLTVWRQRVPSAGQQASRRLTFDSGVQTQPTLSPLGDFVVYSSNQSGNFELWFKLVADGAPENITKHPAHDWQPDWSPTTDGQIVFRSERDGGGLYVIPASGGDVEHIANFGYFPRWSPDGSRVVFVEHFDNSYGGVFVARRDGSPLMPIDLTGLKIPRGTRKAVGWHPDGKRITVFSQFALATIDVATGAFTQWRVPDLVQERFRDLDLRLQPHPVVWSADRRAIFFAGYSQELSSIWRIGVDPDTEDIVDGPSRLTSMTESSSFCLAADGQRMILDNLKMNARIWIYPLGTDGLIHGDGTPITSDALNAFAPDLSADGGRLLFGVERPGGPRHVHEWSYKALIDGPATKFATTIVGRDWQYLFRWSHNGTRISYRNESIGSAGPEFSIKLFDVATERTEQLTSPVRDGPDNPYGWSPDGKSIIVSSNRGNPNIATIARLSIADAPRAETGAVPLTVSHDYLLYNPTVSPAGTWVAFQAVRAPASKIVVMRLSAGAIWQDVTDGKFWDDKPKWSADGTLLYFISRRGGLFHVWAVRFDPATGLPTGEPFAVTPFPGQDGYIPWDGAELGIGQGRLAIPITNPTGGLWILNRPGS